MEARWLVHPPIRIASRLEPSSLYPTGRRLMGYSQSEFFFNLCVHVLVRPTRISPRQSGAAGPCM
jgi:hypothetical protein